MHLCISPMHHTNLKLVSTLHTHAVSQIHKQAKDENAYLLILAYIAFTIHWKNTSASEYVNFSFSSPYRVRVLKKKSNWIRLEKLVNHKIKLKAELYSNT